MEMKSGSSIGWLSYVGKMSGNPEPGRDVEVAGGLVPGRAAGGRSSFVLEKGYTLIGVHYKTVKKSQRFKRNLVALNRMDDGMQLLSQPNSCKQKKPC